MKEVDKIVELINKYNLDKKTMDNIKAKASESLMQIPEIVETEKKLENFQQISQNAATIDILTKALIEGKSINPFVSCHRLVDGLLISASKSMEENEKLFRFCAQVHKKDEQYEKAVDELWSILSKEIEKVSEHQRKINSQIIIEINNFVDYKRNKGVKKYQGEKL